MSLYKIQLLTNLSEQAKKRFPPIEELDSAIKEYKQNGYGIIIKHDSLYDYQYDTKLSGYHVVDSKNISGHIVSHKLENNKIFLYIELNKPEDFIGKNLICLFRATMQTDPTKNDPKLHYKNLFVVDLVEIQDNEFEDYLPISQIEEVDENEEVS